MASYAINEDVAGGYGVVGGGGAGYGGFGGFGGSWCIMIVFFVIAWLLFKDGHHGRGFDGGRDGCGCGCRPHFPDESNWEEELHLTKEHCKDREEIHCEGEKTRALIENNYIQDLRDKLSEKSSEILTLKSEMFMGAKFGELNHRFDRLECELPKRPPVFADCATVCTNNIVPSGCFPRRGHCDCDGFAGAF